MRKTALVAMAAVIIMVGRAEAAIYTFKPGPLSASASPFYSQDNLSFSIGINDAAVRSGMFTYDYRYRFGSNGNPPQITFMPSAIGDVSSFQFFRGGTGSATTTGPVDSSSASFAVNLTFTPGGQAFSGSVDYSTDGYYVFLTGAGGAFSGTAGFGSEFPANVSGPVSGGLPTSVPEPASFALLAAPLLIAGATRRSRPGTLSRELP